ncbi:MAG: Gfo/Idh/MocA family oxidoreductase, partial [Clostridia bacterium]
MKKTLGWAVIGCGTISKNHLDAVAKLTHTHLQAVCDIIPARAEEAAKEYGAVKCYTDYLEMLRDPDVDIVSICTPSGMHGDMAIACAAAGKHIFCEKPMDVTHEKMVAMERAARDAGVKFGCVFQRRTYPEALAVRKFIEEHDLGPIIFAEARLKYHRTQEYYDSGDWRATWDLDGGGALMNQGVHGVDLLHWLVGDVKSVYAICRTLAHDIKVEDAAIAVLEFENGAIGTIRGTTCVYPAQETQISLH